MSLFRPLTSSSKIPFRPVRVCLIKQLSINLLQTINICNRPHFIPVLTIPGEAVFNNGLDNINYDLIVKAGDTIGSSTSIEGVKYSMNPFTITKYKILGSLGHGSFGQVYKCLDIINNVEVAVKILRNKEPYFKQGLIELSAVELLNKYFDPSPNSAIIKMKDYFLFFGHICIVTEILGAPEIVLGIPYSCAIDMWSLGCIVVELYLGSPLFASSSEYNLLYKMIDTLGEIPSTLLKQGTKTKQYFHHNFDDTYELKEQFEYEYDNNCQVEPNYQYFYFHKLKDLIDKNPIKIVQSDTQSVNTFKQTLYDFVKRCLEFDPKDRITPQQALEHPFIKGNSMNNWWLPQREVPYRVLDKGLTLNEKQTQELLRLELNPNPDLKVIFEIFNKAIKKGEVLNVFQEFPTGTITPKTLSDYCCKRKNSNTF
ncbi:Serine/threonine protein kinase ppk15 [Entamoeba marina]